ncbi:hypothetical protein EAF04_007067 [Stromatinia cepivora]|nr:hypothetical protein EAF04_007067 [Stromatinia cepivora]
MVKQDGLKWVAKTFGLEPHWTSTPDIAKIKVIVLKHLKLEECSLCDVTFYAQGAFNKLYKIETENECFLIRITLPVDPFNKTNSEIATINFIHRTTDIPVPRILAFDDSSENDLGYEWILMDMLPGRTLRAKWRNLSKNSKRDLVKQIAQYQSQIFRHKFSAIGNIFVIPVIQHGTKKSPQEEEAGEAEKSQMSADPGKALQDSQLSLPALGKVVSMIFFWGDHIAQDVPRGPFTKSEDWIRARLIFVLIDQENILKTSKDEDDIEDAQNAKDLVERLLKLLPSIFPANESTAEQCVLFHDDLSMQNILVDDDGKITGVVDWECVSTLPLWRSCSFPEFLKGRDRIEEPMRDRYGPDNDEEFANELQGNELDNEGINSLYWEHLLEYELTILRDLFLKEMENIALSWIKEFRKGSEKADFEWAVQACDSVWQMRKIKNWLDAREKGENWSLRKSSLE